MIFGTSYVTKEFTFDAMHQLPNHNGLCKNYHGHTYIVHVTLTGLINETEGSPSEGMVYDFSHLKRIFQKEIADKADHAFIAKGDEVIELNGDTLYLADVLEAQGMRVFRLGVRSTAENISKWIFETIAENTPKYVFVKNVRVYETPKSWADYKARDYESTPTT